ncbi:MAG: hypothetical protein ACRD21_14555 [Vicinamibacteria bacterium]
MARLAQYMEDLAVLLGHQESVHFLRLEPGSTVLVQLIDEENAPKVRKRLDEVKLKRGPAEAMRAFENIDRLLETDQAVGVLEESDGGKLVEFPGRARREKLDFGGVTQTESIDGIPIRIGGKEEWVPILLQTEKAEVISGAYAKRELAKEIAPHLFTDVIRVHGRGRYHRTPEGVWLLDRFTITDFEVLDSSPLRDVVERLRKIEGSEWPEVEDPLEELRRLRHG